MKSASLTEFTLHSNFPAMVLSDGFDDCQPQTSAALGQRFAICTAIELFKQGGISLGDADAAIFYRKGQRDLDFGKYIKLPLCGMQVKKAANTHAFQKV